MAVTRYLKITHVVQDRDENITRYRRGRNHSFSDLSQYNDRWSSVESLLN